ncbi:hypothetical protein FACS1894120_0670 [Clostridia bacterium]|nr:hypothetical protein FACS1894120_0670 [Clostridia bacterium]
MTTAIKTTKLPRKSYSERGFELDENGYEIYEFDKLPQDTREAIIEVDDIIAGKKPHGAVFANVEDAFAFADLFGDDFTDEEFYAKYEELYAKH